VRSTKLCKLINAGRRGEHEHANAVTAITILHSMPHALTTELQYSGGGIVYLFLKLGDKDHCTDLFWGVMYWQFFEHTHTIHTLAYALTCLKLNG